MAKKEPPKKKPGWIQRWNDAVDKAAAKESQKGQGKNKTPITKEEIEAAKRQQKRRADHQMYSENERGVKHSYVDCFCSQSGDHLRPGG